jgi:hypothetical protein
LAFGQLLDGTSSVRPFRSSEKGPAHPRPLAQGNPKAISEGLFSAFTNAAFSGLVAIASAAAVSCGCYFFQVVDKEAKLATPPLPCRQLRHHTRLACAFIGDLQQTTKGTEKEREREKTKPQTIPHQRRQPDAVNWMGVRLFYFFCVFSFVSLQQRDDPNKEMPHFPPLCGCLLFISFQNSHFLRYVFHFAVMALSFLISLSWSQGTEGLLGFSVRHSQFV